MNIKKLSALLFLIVAVSSAFAQDANEEAKKHLHTAFRMYEAKYARYGAVAVPGEYVMNGDKITGQYYISSTYSTSYIPGNVFIAEYLPDATYPKVIMRDGNCTPQHMEVYQLVTSTPSPNVTRLEEKGYAINGHGNKVREFHVVEYGADNRVKSVNSGYIVLDKKSGAVMFEFITSETTYSWKSGTDVAITTTHYYDKKKAKDDRIKISSNSYHHVIEKNKLATTNESGQDLLFATSGNETTLQVRKKDTNDAYKISNKYTTDGDKLVKAENFSYNAQTGELESRSISEYTFEKPNGSSQADLCALVKKSFTSVYDAKDNLVKEMTDAKVREKNPDGSWGEWKFFRM